MSTGYFKTVKTCKIGKKVDKSDCTKKDCENCRHWIISEVWQDCMNCKNDCFDCYRKEI